MSAGRLLEQSIQFSVEIVNYYKWLTGIRKEYVMSKQILRSGTSIGANLHEANYAASRADFIAKLQIALKEAAETEYWLIILETTGYFGESFCPMKSRLMEIKRMLIASLNTAKRN